MNFLVSFGVVCLMVIGAKDEADCWTYVTSGGVPPQDSVAIKLDAAQVALLKFYSIPWVQARHDVPAYARGPLHKTNGA